MEFTTIGYILLPLVAIFLCIKDPRPLLGLAIAAAALQGAGAINIPRSGLPISLLPFHFVACIVAFRLITDLIRRKWSLASICRRFPRELAVLYLFTAWVILATVLLPFVFRGIYVDSPRLGMDGIYYSHLIPLQWTHSNLAQILYISLDVSVLLYFFALLDRKLSVVPLIRWFVATAASVICIGYYQLIASKTGIPFPYQTLYSNIVAFPDVYKFAAHLRVFSTFTEPSYLGSFASVVLGMSLSTLFYSGQYTAVAIGMAFSSLLLIPICGATTGFIGATFALGLFVYFAGQWAIRNKSLPTSVLLVGIAVPFTAMAALPLFGQRLFDRVVTESVLDKLSTSSALHRFHADLVGIRIFLETNGLGAGLGSDRPSSLITSLLACTGLIGTSLFFIFLYKILQKGLSYSADRYNHGTIDPRIAATGLIIQLLTMVAAIPDVTWPFLWIFLGLTIALQEGRTCPVISRRLSTVERTGTL